MAGGEEGGKEERILVSVRLRPPNAKEIEKHEPLDWEAIGSNTLSFKPKLSDRSVQPSSYTFDRVFGFECNTRKVYEEGAKEVALSVVSGINSSIFAYGQTSSGKTYTMTGVTRHAMKDIYDYMSKHEEREFVLKFSAMEIYNEAVKDLLGSDSCHSSPLRLLDDPERGTVVEKLTEETLRDEMHLSELLSICAAQRQVGETALNEMSSRSHQILRLTIESTSRKFTRKGPSSVLIASVNFVDLSGSERASQVSTANNRLKEGCHINKSLLALGTVIRKLSKGRTGHIPYRDSKLTRILQPFLGGNARTAIICTMNGTRSHNEQSRNTLLFASCAKQVVTNAQVNVVMSDKAMVKQLQRELARLESELKHPRLSSVNQYSDALKDKEAQINKMEQEIKALMEQKDLAETRLSNLLLAVVDEQASRQWEEASQCSVSHTRSESEDAMSISGASVISYEAPDFSSIFDTPGETNKYYYHQQQHSDKTIQHRRTVSSPSSVIAMVTKQGRDAISDGTTSQDSDAHCGGIEVHAPSNLLHEERGAGRLEGFRPQSIKLAARASRSSVSSPLPPQLLPSVQEAMVCDELAITRSSSCKPSLMDSSVLSLLEDGEQDNKKPEGGHQDGPSALGCADKSEISERVLMSLEELMYPEKAETQKVKTVTKENNCNEITPTPGMVDVADNQCQKPVQISDQIQLKGNKDGKKKKKDAGIDATPSRRLEPAPQWPSDFERKQQEIIELWHACHVPLVHRTNFFLLFKGDPSDAFYIEVESRRLSFLRNIFSHGHIGDVVAEDGHRFNLSSSLRSLRKEREMLSKKMNKTWSHKQRDSVYANWGIPLSSKQRRVQLAQLLWSQTDMQHVKESAAIVAQLMGFIEGPAMKEMVGLNFTPQSNHHQHHHRRSFTWVHG